MRLPFPIHRRCALYLIFGFLYLWASYSLFRRSPVTTFVDTRDYFQIAELSLSGSGFWTGTKPVLIPLVYKVFSNNAALIAGFQWIFAMGCWLIFSLSATLLFQKSSFRVGVYCFFLLLSLSPHIFHWHVLMLSESLANSLFVLASASWIMGFVYFRGRPAVGTVGQIAVACALLTPTLLWSFCRDTHQFFLLGAGLLGLMSLILLRNFSKTWTPFLLVFTTGLLATFWGQSQLHRQAGRWRFSFANLIEQRIAPDPEMNAFFQARNIPLDAALFRAPPGEARAEAVDFDLGLANRARTAYMAWLAAHPFRSLTAPFLHLEQLFDRDVYVYGKLEPPVWQKVLGLFFFSRIGLWLAVSAGVFLFLIVSRRGRLAPHLPPLILIPLAYPLMFAVWHGDSLEIARHAQGLSLQVRIALFLFLGLTLESFAIFYAKCLETRRSL